MSFDRHHVCRLAAKDCTTIANAMKCLILGFLAHGGISNIADDDEEDEGHLKSGERWMDPPRLQAVIGKVPILGSVHDKIRNEEDLNIEHRTPNIERRS